MKGESIVAAPPLRAIPLDDEIRTIEEQIARFRAGELPPEKFRAFRLVYGIYGQRQPGVQMVRVKIPNGVLGARGLEALAGAAENHGHGLCHVTTRQAVQFHYVPLDEVPALLRRVGAAGLTSREACMNSVRNVTSCPYSGVCADEPFPTLPYAQATARFLMRHPGAQILSRKFKIAFSGCATDCAMGAIHDIGAIAAAPERGFRLLVGGGLGSTPFLAQELEPFIPAGEILRAAEAVVRLLSLYGNRRNKARARLKFVVANQGIEEFRRRYREMLATLDAVDPAELRVETYLDEGELALLGEGKSTAGDAPPLPVPDVVPALAASYGSWLSENTRPQSDPRFRAVTVSLPLGDIAPRELRALAAAMRSAGTDEIHTTIQQNFLIRNVPIAALGGLFGELHAAGLAAPSAATALDVTSCPGADTCNLGITSSKGLARAITRELEASGLALADLRGTKIKISGCPNACGQHYVAGIGLHGVARNLGERTMPGYQLHLGGRISGSVNRVGRAGLKIPAKKAPEAVRRLIQIHLRERADGEDLADFLARADAAQVKSWLADLMETPASADPAGDLFTDWDRDEPFSTDSIQQGEGAGAGVDKGADPFEEAVLSIREARLYMARSHPGDALPELNRAVLAAARIVLGSGLGKECRNDWETICEFRGRLVDRGHASEAWDGLRAEFDALLLHRGVAPVTVEALLPRVEAFLVECRGLLAAVETWRADPEAAPLHGLTPHGKGEEIG